MTIECHGLDTPERVCFYEQDFYVLSNFSAFRLMWRGHDFDTSEHAYHWEKFAHGDNDIDRMETLAKLCGEIKRARSAHDAFKLAEANKGLRRRDWDIVKIPIMREILAAKAHQNEYVRRKLLATGDRLLVENSWRDSFWGWGEDQKGQNMLGTLWMMVREQLRNEAAADTAA